MAINVSQAILQGRKHEAGSVVRVPAIEITRRVAEAVGGTLSASDGQHSSGSHSAQRGATGFGAPTNLPNTRLRAIDLHDDLRGAVERVVVSRTTIEIELAERGVGEDQDRVLIIPSTPPTPYRRWLDELRDQTSQSLAAHEGKTKRSIRVTLSLAFICPILLKAGLEGRLPRGWASGVSWTFRSIGRSNGQRLASRMLGAAIGMLVVEAIAEIRRAYFSLGKPIKEICRELHLSPKVVREGHSERDRVPLRTFPAAASPDWGLATAA